MTLRKPPSWKRAPLRVRRWACAHCRIKNDPAKKKCAGCGIGKSTKRTSLKARCDAMARELCRLLAKGKCAHCGVVGPTDWAHVHRRAKHSVRWSMDNCFALCRACHRYFTERPFEFVRFVIDERGPKAAADLECRANSPWDKDYSRVIAELSAQLAQLRRAA